MFRELDEGQLRFDGTVPEELPRNEAASRRAADSLDPVP
jgi:hypothetical protein